VCLPTASALPVASSGDFGTSPFYGQPWTSHRACHETNMGASKTKHKKLIATKSRPREWTLLPRCIIFRS
jgi:hypothetical protein